MSVCTDKEGGSGQKSHIPEYNYLLDLTLPHLHTTLIKVNPANRSSSTPCKGRLEDDNSPVKIGRTLPKKWFKTIAIKICYCITFQGVF